MRKFKTIILSLVLIISLAGIGYAKLDYQPVYAATDTDGLCEMIEDTIESDKKDLNDLSPILKKAYEKLVSAFKKLGTLAKDISKVVKMYNALDETSEDYPEKLQEFFKEYNKLGPVKRKVVDFCTGVLNAKDQLLANVRHIVLVDLYSEKQLDGQLDGEEVFVSENEAVAVVSKSGKITATSVGITKVEATNSAGEEETFRIFVKKPLLASKVAVKKGNKINITVSSEYSILKVVSGSNKISVEQNGNVLSVEGKKKGTAYIYVGTTSGKTLKYKVKISG
ncbi:MAG: Ig-like domain-containing protein [Lachnospiraceae bacterium]|nr:Ig-like domain-containing protein [Lachnospiraceae bacterium]